MIANGLSNIIVMAIINQTITRGEIHTVLTSLFSLGRVCARPIYNTVVLELLPDNGSNEPQHWMY